MGFGAAFGGGFRPAFDAGGAVATPWYRAGGAPLPVAAYQSKGAASYAASKVNLANPGTYDATDGTAYPTWDAATGWTFDGTKYLKTGITPATDHTWSMLVRYTRDAMPSWGDWFTLAGMQGVAAKFCFGLATYNSSGIYQLQARHGGLKRWNNSATSGVLGMASTTGYFNGSELTGAILTGTSETVYAIYIGAENYGNSPSRYHKGTIQALAIYNVTLSGPQVAAVSAAMSLL